MNAYRASLAATVAFGSMLVAPTAALAEGAFGFNLAAQPLADSLRAVAIRAAVNVAFDPTVTRDRTAPTLIGSYSAEQALQRLTARCGLSVRATTSRTFLVEAPRGVLQGHNQACSDRPRLRKVAFAQADPVPRSSAVSRATPQKQEAISQGQDEIIVTARRQAESLQSVPLSIQAFGDQTLREQAITQVSDLTRLVPGLTAQPTFAGKSVLILAIRGQRQGLGNIAYDPPVSVYSDEMLQSRPHGLNDGFFDLESVQVLKGPQGTLFGRNTTGGAILITSKAPTDRFEGYLDGTVGNYGLVRLESALNLPITSSLAIRVAGVITRHDGYINDPAVSRRVEDQNTQSWRASLRFSPVGSALENRLVLSGFHERDSGPAFKATMIRPGSLSAAAQTDIDFYNTRSFWTTNAAIPAEGTRVKTFTVLNITSLDLGSVTLKNIIGHRTVRSSIELDIDGTGLFINHNTQDARSRQFTNEFQIIANLFDRQLNLTSGIYYLHERVSEVLKTHLFSLDSPTNLITDYSIATSSAAAYSQGTFRPNFAPDFSVTAGLRFTKDTKKFETRARRFNNVCRLLSANVNGVPLSPCFRSESANFQKPTYTLSADWKFAPDSLIYISHRYGYQSGGFTNSAATPAEFIPYQPQTVSDIELGFKSRWNVGGISGRTNIALFRGKYKDNQRLFRFTVNNPGAPPSSANRIINAASSTVQGLEFDGAIRLGEAAEISGAYTYLDAHYDKYIVPGAGDFTDSLFAGAPRHSATAAVRVRIPTPESVGLVHVQVDGAYQSRTVTDDTNNLDPITNTIIDRTILPAYTVLNARFDVKKMGGLPLDLSAYIQNLTNKKFYSAGIDVWNALGFVTRLLGPPRTVGVRLRYEF